MSEAKTAAPARDSTWDIARGIGMALVIYGHFLEPIYPAQPAAGKAFLESAFTQWQWIYSFHMMLFFLVSGAVNLKLPKKAWPDVVRGSLRLQALAWVVHLLGIVVVFSLGLAPEALTSPWTAAVAVFNPILQGFLWSVGVLWFLTALCFVQLLAYVLLRYLPAWSVVLIGMAGTAVVVYFDAPNQFLFRTWMPGLSFFALGVLFAQWQVKWPAWLCVPLFVAVYFLAPLNSGCAYTMHDACARWAGPFGVRMFGGNYGFLPLFFLTSLAGALGVVCLSRGLSKFKGSEVFAHMGRKSLDLFVINGFVATFLPPYIARFDWSWLNPMTYVLVAVVLVAVHLLVQWLLRRPLAGIDTAALRIATFLTGLVSPVVQEKKRSAPG
jgi:fucose 4-O-acetylase-like acetyltransferase